MCPLDPSGGALAEQTFKQQHADLLPADCRKRFRYTAYATSLHSQMGHEPGLGYHAVDAIGGPHDDTYYGVTNGIASHGR